jgi:hypothetical protein
MLGSQDHAFWQVVPLQSGRQRQFVSALHHAIKQCSVEPYRSVNSALDGIASFTAPQLHPKGDRAPMPWDGTNIRTLTAIVVKLRATSKETKLLCMNMLTRDMDTVPCIEFSAFEFYTFP